MAALPSFVGMLLGLFGGEPDFKRVSLLGVTTALTEQGFNRMAGLTPEEDKLPEFFIQEKSPATGAVFDINPYEIAVMFDV
jgi:aldehyde:ferredoxin oxidoreductase